MYKQTIPPTASGKIKEGEPKLLVSGEFGQKAVSPETSGLLPEQLQERKSALGIYDGEINSAPTVQKHCYDEMLLHCQGAICCGARS